MIKIIKPLINQFMPFAQKRMGFDKPPRLFLRSDVSNADNPLGKTAYYDPNEQKVVLYITGRHPKDVMRSLSHELVHHTQNLRGDFDNVQAMGDGYAQNDAHLREMEREAYEMGNLCFRDWEDSIKHTIYFEHLQKGVATVMSTKDWKNKEVQSLLSESWGFKMNLDNLTEAKGKKPETEKEKEFAALADPEDEITHADRIAGATEADKKKKNEAKHEDDDKEKMEEGGCPSDDTGHAMMVVDDQPDMYGDSEMDVEAKLDMILDKLSALMGGDTMEDEQLDEQQEPPMTSGGSAEEKGVDCDKMCKEAAKILDAEHKTDVESGWIRGFGSGAPAYARRTDEQEEILTACKECEKRQASVAASREKSYLSEAKLRKAVRRALKASIKKA